MNWILSSPPTHQKMQCPIGLVGGGANVLKLDLLRWKKRDGAKEDLGGSRTSCNFLCAGPSPFFLLW